MGKRLEWCILALSLLPSIHLVWQARDLPTLGLYHDDAIYWNAARTLAAGGGYTIDSLPWRPAQTKYPPLYPLYLSLAIPLAPSQPLAVALWLNWLWLPAFVSASYLLLLRCGLPAWAPVTISAILAVHPASLLAVSRLMSDLMYAALALWCLVLVNRRGADSLAGLAFLARTAGITLLGALWLHHCRLRRWGRAAALAATALLPVLGWSLWCRAYRHPGTSLAELYYSDYMAFQWHVIPLAPGPILSHLGEQILFTFAASSRALLATFGEGGFSVPASLLFFSLPVMGGVHLALREPLRPYFLYAALLLPLLWFWYYRVDERALLPLLPLLWASLTVGLVQMINGLGLAWRRGGMDRTLALVLGLALAAYPVFAIRQATASILRDGYDSLHTERRYNPPLDAAYSWIRRHTDSATTFLAINDPDFYLHTGRRAMRLPFIEDIYVQAPGRPVQLSDAGLAAMRQFRLDCVLISAKHFARTSQPAVRFSTTGKPLVIRYQSPTETIACLDSSNSQ